MDNLTIEQIDGGIVLTVKVVPGSSKTAVAGILDGMLKVKVSSPAEKGKANKCLIEFLAKQLGVKKSDIKIVSGQTSPVKTIRVQDISPEYLLEKLRLGQA